MSGRTIAVLTYTSFLIYSISFFCCHLQHSIAQTKDFKETSGFFIIILFSYSVAELDFFFLSSSYNFSIVDYYLFPYQVVVAKGPKNQW